jgi:hypothetical protein
MGRGQGGGRPRSEPSEEMILRARELLGLVFHRSKVVQQLMREFDPKGIPLPKNEKGEVDAAGMEHAGRPLAYKALNAAVDEFRKEIKGDDLLVQTVAGYIEVASNPLASKRDKNAALNGLVKILALDKLAANLNSADEIREFLKRVGLNHLARAGEKPATGE